MLRVFLWSRFHHLWSHDRRRDRNAIIIIIIIINLMCANLQACRNFDNDNSCENFCPPEYVYSQALYRQVPNPDAKYAYGALCVDKCPCRLTYMCANSALFRLLNIYSPVFSVIANACTAMKNSGWLDKIDQTWFLDQNLVWVLICINFSSDDKRHKFLKFFKISSEFGLIFKIWPMSGLRPNLIRTIQSNWQLRNVKIQTFAANL